MGKKYFLAGTDTDVGKTFASCALLTRAKQSGQRTIGLKPVAAGATEYGSAWKNEDAVLLEQHMTESLMYEQINPVLLKEPASPHIAAHMEGRTVSVSRIAGICKGALMKPFDFALVEGAGGWRVPLNKTETMATLARELGFPVILVVGLRLGCLNHAMLTVEAIRNDGLELAGWIGNRLSEHPMRHEAENLATLESAMPGPCIGVLPYSVDGDAASVCKNMHLDRLEL